MSIYDQQTKNFLNGFFGDVANKAGVSLNDFPQFYPGGERLAQRDTGNRNRVHRPPPTSAVQPTWGNGGNPLAQGNLGFDTNPGTGGMSKLIDPGFGAKPSVDSSMPSWVQAPDPNMGYMQALTDLTNPTTGETWTAPHGGYSVRPTPTSAVQPTGTQGTGGKGVGDVVSAQPQTTGQNFFPQPNIYQSPITVDSAQSLIQLANTPQGPYRYGDLGNTGSSYNIWGSKGNPYLVAGPTYTPGSGAPIVPSPVAQPVAPVASHSGNNSPISDWVDPNSPEAQAKSYGDLQSWIGRNKYATRGAGSLLGMPLLDPAIDFAYGINPYTQKSLSWYDGSTDFDNNVYTDQDLNVDAYNAALAAYDLDWQDGMTDLNQNEYVNQYLAESAAADATAKETPGLFDGLWGDPTGELAQQATAAIAADKQRVADNIQKRADIELAAQKAEQAKAIAASRADAERYTGLTNQIDSLTNQLGSLQSVNSQQYNDLLSELETVEGSLMNEINAVDIANNTYYNNTYNQTFAPTNTITGNTGGWSNPAAGVDTSTLSGSTGTTNASFTNDGTGNVGGMSFTSDETGTVSGTDYGNGMSGWDDGTGNEVGYEDPGGSDGGGSSGGGGGGGSYIATAATQALGTDGLKLFEDWRDYMFTKLPTFTTSYGRYRVTAPKIVAEIDKKENSKELYKEIWDKHLKPIFELIKEDKDNPKALSDYKVMVKELMNEYLRSK